MEGGQEGRNLLGLGVFAGACVCVGTHVVRAGLAPPPPGVQTLTAYGKEFAVVAAPGNAPYSSLFGLASNGRGSVNYEYGIARTEVSASEWIAFVTAYAPYVKPEDDHSGFTSTLIVDITPPASPARVFAFEERHRNVAVAMNWRMAARYCNWLQNDRRTDRAAFESGVYDTSTFTRNADGTVNDNTTHSPNAKVWIPSADEWVKAAYYDPNRFGAGQGGYWDYLNGKDRLSIPGYPSEGGETLAGREIGPRYSDIGEYANVQSPWGLFDTSGGEIEWTSTPQALPGTTTVFPGEVYTWGSPSFTPDADISEGLFISGRGGATSFGPEGLRLAAAVPTPNAGALAVFVACWMNRLRLPRFGGRVQSMGYFPSEGAGPHGRPSEVHV